MNTPPLTSPISSLQSSFTQAGSPTGNVVVAQIVLWVCLLASLSPATQAQSRQVVAIAHRGEHLHHPENTLPAYQEAIRVGADFIEVDVRTTADGRLVLCHDNTVNRTTDGTGEVSSLTFEQIEHLDA